jgi:CubicO group peptidase (beta-lactamase class C family)
MTDAPAVSRAPSKRAASVGSLALGLIAALTTCRAPDISNDSAPSAPVESASAKRPAPVAWKSAELERISAAVRSWIDAEEVVGAEFMILKDEEVVLHDVAGWKDRERREPMERGTIFCIRSMTKPIVGTAVQILIDEKKLALDDKASKFLPSFDNERARDITIEEMLTHRSGFPITLMDRPVKEYANHRAVVDQAGAIGPHAKPGEKFEYSDTNFETLAEIVGVVSGMAPEEFVRARILAPLGMRDTYCVLGKDAPDRRRVSSNYIGAVGHWEKYWDHDDEPMFPIFLGAAGAYSTCADYARFVALWLHRGRSSGVEIVSEAAVDRALHPVARMLAPYVSSPVPTAFDGWRVDYGEAWMIWTGPTASANGALPVFGHGGSDGTFAWVFPDAGVIALYFTQSRNGMSGMRFEELVASLVGISTKPPAASKSGGPLPIEALAPMVGGYGSGDLGAYMFLRIESGRLVADVPGSSTTPLAWPDAQGRWPFAGTSQAALEFHRGELGARGSHADIDRIDLVQSGKTYAFLPLSRSDLPSVDELQALRKKSCTVDVRSLRMHAAIEMQKQTGEATVIAEKSSEGMLRFSSHLQFGAVDQTVIVDGEHVFTLAPKSPREDITGSRGESVRLANPLERLGDWRHDGAEVEVVDKLESQGRACWVVRVKPRSLPTLLRWVDVENGRVLFEHAWQVTKGLPTTPQTLEFSNWRSVDGVDLPAHIERQAQIGGKLTIDYDTIEVNVPVAPDVFSPPDDAHR